MYGTEEYGGVGYGSIAPGSITPPPATTTPYQLLVSGVDLSAYLRQDGWNVTQNFGRQGDSAHMELRDDFTQPLHLVGGHPAPNFVIKPLQSVILKTTLNTPWDTTLFAGRVTTPNFASVSPVANDWIMNCVDYTSDTDNIIVSGDYNGWSADAIIKDLVRQANAQFLAHRSNGGIALTTNHVIAGPVIQRVQINYLTLSTAIVKVVRLASQYVDYAWYIDYFRDVHFTTIQAAAGTPTATFTDATVIAPDTAILGHFLTDNYAYEWDGASLRNSMMLRGTTFQTNFHDTWVGNGRSTSWPLTYHVTATSSASVRIGNADMTVTILDNANNTGHAAIATTQFVITMNTNGQWFLQVNGSYGATPARGVAISLSYTYDAPIVARADSLASQAKYAGTNGGIFQAGISDSTLVTLSSAVQRGQVELQAFQWVQERVTFTTQDGWPGHISAGQTFVLNSSRTPDSQNGYAMGLVGTFVVVSNTYGGTRGGYRGYTITGTRVL